MFDSKRLQGPWSAEKPQLENIPNEPKQIDPE